jgi:hypothetical protein
MFSSFVKNSPCQMQSNMVWTFIFVIQTVLVSVFIADAMNPAPEPNRLAMQIRRNGGTIFYATEAPGNPVYAIWFEGKKFTDEKIITYLSFFKTVEQLEFKDTVVTFQGIKQIQQLTNLRSLVFQSTGKVKHLTKKEIDCILKVKKLHLLTLLRYTISPKQISRIEQQFVMVQRETESSSLELAG